MLFRNPLISLFSFINMRKLKMERISWKLLCGLICLIIILCGLFTHFFLNSVSSINQNQNPQQTINRAFSFKAAIIDHLSISDPNPFFIEAVTNMLEKANFTVDYYGREKIKVDFYRNLATHDYGLIIFRVHSGHEPVTFFFSGEEYNTNEHFWEQWNDQVGQGQLPDERITYFSIRPTFVKYSMKGSFYKTVIIAMGCSSLRTTGMAEAFIEKGAAVYIGWNASLNAFHGDLATLSVIKYLLLENQTVKDAVDAATKEVGPCPANEPGTTSVLSFYPLSSQNYIIPYATNSSQKPQD